MPSANRGRSPASGGMPVQKHDRAEESRDHKLMLLVEDLRNCLAEIDAYTNVAGHLLQRLPWALGRPYRRDLNRLGYIIDLAARTASAALDDMDARFALTMRSYGRQRRGARRQRRGQALIHLSHRA